MKRFTKKKNTERENNFKDCKINVEMLLKCSLELLELDCPRLPSILPLKTDFCLQRKFSIFNLFEFTQVQ